MHGHMIERGGLDGVERGLGCKRFVSELRGRGLTTDDAADVVCQIFCVPRGAARLYVRTHPAWSTEAPAMRPRWAEASRP
jgi:hypothetical protein